MSTFDEPSTVSAASPRDPGDARLPSLEVGATGGERDLSSLLELSCDWVWEMDESLRFTSVRRLNRGKLILTDGQILGRRRWELEGELIRPATWAQHQASLEARQPFRDLIFRRWHPNGETVYHLVGGDPVLDAGGRFRGYRGVGKDITALVRTQESIERLATFDALTGLPNRHAFDERAQRLLSQRQLSSAYSGEGRACAMLYIDLDDFGLVNKSYGHRVGDEALAQVAQRVRAIVQEPNLLGRRGGDELVALLVDVPSHQAAIETASRLIEAIAQPARVSGMDVAVTASIGVAFFPQDGVDLDPLLNAADAAMFHAKQKERNTYTEYTQAVKRRMDLRLRLEQWSRRGFEAPDFRMVYQPLVSMTSGRMEGAEALLRWKDVELGDISPAEFIPIAEESGLILGVGDWVLREVCRQIRMWRQIGLDVPTIAINISGKQLQQTRFTESVLAVLGQFELTPADIDIEVTEHGLLEATETALSNLNQLRKAGMQIVLDDFGVGYSSLSHLLRLPISRLKIDRSFTEQCVRDARTVTIVKAVVDMAHDLRWRVTAEGIETLAQQSWMQHLKCDSAQGYLLARPMSPEDFVKAFAERGEIGRDKSLMR